MALPSLGKFDKMYQFLSEQNFEMDENVPNEFKCSKCEKLLINSYVGSCLCQFCRRCINEMINNGLEYCTGSNDECKEEKLVNFVPDHVTNNKLSKLLLKCPDQMCSHQCELVKMEEHLRLCSNRSVECPFYGMGCNKDKLVADQINVHLQAESYHHNNILVDMVRTLENELKERNERHKTEIKKLSVNAQTKDEEYRDHLDRTMKQINDEIQKCQLQLTNRIDGLEKWQDRQMDVPFTWRINKISNKIQSGTKIFSTIFYSKINSYKMQLRMGNDGDIDETQICLLIYASELDSQLSWPYKGNITIKISNKTHANASKSLAKFCKINKPDNNLPNSSDPFKFSFTELSSLGLTQDDYFIIQCCEE